MSHYPPSPEIAAIRIATERIVTELRRQTREQARLIRSGAAGELTEADVERMAKDISAAAHAQLEAVTQDWQIASDDPGMQATRREVAQLMAAGSRQVDADLRKAWQARHQKAAGRRWRR